MTFCPVHKQKNNTISMAASVPTNRDIYRVAWPMTLKALMLHGIIVIDAYLISSLGEAALAAMGIVGAVAGLLLGILFAFSNATQNRIAQSFGGAGPLGLKTAFYCGVIINLVAVFFGGCWGRWPLAA